MIINFGKNDILGLDENKRVKNFIKISKTLLEKAVNDSTEHSIFATIASQRVAAAVSVDSNISNLLNTANSGNVPRTHLDLMGIGHTTADNSSHPSFNNIAYQTIYNTIANNYNSTKITLSIRFNTTISNEIGGFTSFVPTNARKKNFYICRVKPNSNNVFLTVSNGQTQSKFRISDVPNFFSSTEFVNDNEFGTGTLQAPKIIKGIYVIKDIKFGSSTSI